ncbi:MAG: L-asparaginase [Gemmatimonadetes bacterium]|nr:asparaginase [Gemmatimonadota bacterium]NIR79383.1 asparaginase [Gemmatimonadota bacterium]NIT88060.1 asparaginase [Gemmatimonadota bacterium]NIU31892.1 asparaginase [Gemmatimonadota bacterium]NIU36507.1 L-asparaginase [Gemmatimonadota bacterium]
MRARAAAVSTLSVLLACALPAVALVPGRAGAQEPDSRPRVLVLTTGGTIASRPDAPSLSGGELVAAVPQVERHARVRVEELFRIGSSAMTPRHWLGVARRIRKAFADDPGLAGVVVTHGTDSMEETAYFLHVTVTDPRPVVVTGAMRPATALSPDGPANLRDAVRVAVSPDARAKGTLVVLNGEIHSARSVRKMDNLRLDAFESPGTGALGVADPDTVIFYRRPLRGYGEESAFAGPLPPGLPAVPVVLDFTGFDGSSIRHWREQGAEGIVVAAFAGGRMSPGAGSEALAAGSAGIPVAVSSRVPGGRVPDGTLEGPDGPDPMVDRGLIAAGDLPPWKARVLLMLALTRTRDPGEVREIFRTH